MTTSTAPGSMRRRSRPTRRPRTTSTWQSASAYHSGADGWLARNPRLQFPRIPSARRDIVKFGWILLGAVLLAPRVAHGQQMAILGTWKFDLKQDQKKEGPRIVIVRPDSSASYGTQTVRWRIVGDSLALALGGEWVNYRLKLKGKN